MTKLESKTHNHYSKIGCVQCKKIHQKCDEKLPKCERCTRKALECVYTSNFIIEDVVGSKAQQKNPKTKINKVKRKVSKFTAYIPSVDNINPKMKAKVVTADDKDDLNIFLIDSPVVKEKELPDGSDLLLKENGVQSNDETNSIKKSPSIKASGFLQLINNDLDSTLTPLSEISSIGMNPKNRILSNVDDNDTPSIELFPSGISTDDIGNEMSTSEDSNFKSIEEEQDSNLNDVSNEVKDANNCNEDDISENFKTNCETYFEKSKNEEFKNQKYSTPNDFSGISHITLEDLVQIMPTDLDFFNMIDMDGDNFYSLNDTYIPHTSSFEVSWKSSVTVDFIGIFQKYDPIQSIFAETGDVSLKDVRMLNFIWTMNKGTRHYFNFPMYPVEIYSEVLEHCAKLNGIYPIIQSVMTYDCAMLLTGIYKKSNKTELFLLWDRQIRIPSFKQCLDILKDRVDAVTNFSETVVLTFAVIIIFSANSSDDSWRTHLRGSYQLVLKSSSLQSSIDPNNEYDYAACKLFEIVKEWFFNAEFLSQVSSNTGFKINRSVSLEYSKTSEDSIAILDNGLSLIGGHSLELKPIFLKIQNVLAEFESRGIYLGGNNLLVFKFTNKDKSLTAEVRSVGFELLLELKDLKYQYRRSKILDYQMEFTLKNSDKLIRLTLELYLSYFFIGNKPIDYFVALLEEILEVIYSIPYYSTACIYCQWSIYLSALVSLLHQKKELYQCFHDVLNSLRQNGMYVTDNSLNRLAHIQKVTESKEYDKLIDPSLDFMLI